MAKVCETEIKKSKEIVVPTIVLYEVYKKLKQLSSEDSALAATSVMSQHRIVDLTEEIALTAADISSVYKFGMADSLILTHALAEKATIVTLDNDFSKIQGAHVLR